MVRQIRFAVLLICLVGAGLVRADEAYVRQYTGPVIDMHLHAFTEFELRNLGGIWTNPLTGRTYHGVTTAADQRAETYRRMEKYNFVKAVTSGSAATNWYKDDPQRILVGGMVGMAPTSVEALRQQYEQGNLHAIGEMGPYYNGLRADDPSVMPFFKLAEELKIPAGYHIMPGGGPGSLYAGGLMANIRAANAGPMQVENVLVTHPQLKLYIMHAAWPYLDDLKALMYAHPQLYVEVSAISWILPRSEFYQFLEGLIVAGYGKRVLYGSDQMGWPETIDESFAAIDGAPFLTPEQKADIFYHNAVRFLDNPEASR